MFSSSFKRMPLGSYFSLYSAVLCLLALLVVDRLEKVDLALSLADERAELMSKTALLASRFEGELNSTLYLVSGLGSYISINGGITNEAFSRIAGDLYATKPGLVNIAAAPDLVVSYVYPEVGNEAAIGLDYRKNPEQWHAVQQVIETGSPIVAGPVNLVQGGIAMIARFPVFTLDEVSGESQLWGILATPYDLERLYQNVDLREHADAYDVAIRGVDGSGAKGDVFYGDSELFEKDAAVYTVHLLSGSWSIASMPHGGWPTVSPNATWIRFVVVVILCLLIGVGGLLALYLRRTEEARIQEAEISLAKTRFYANMSHEIRTPLNAICGMAEVLELSINEVDLRKNARMIRKSGESLTQLLEDVMTLGRMEMDAEQLEAVAVDLEAFVKELIAPLTYEAKRKGLTLEVVPMLEDSCLFMTEPARLRQILWNLLSNAIKFTEEGKVSIEMGRLSSGQMAFTVADTGIGISPDRHRKIFQPYTQLDDSSAREYGGAGIGLSIVQRMVESLRGDIRVESQLGRGARFVVILPPLSKRDPATQKT